MTDTEKIAAMRVAFDTLRDQTAQFKELVVSRDPSGELKTTMQAVSLSAGVELGLACFYGIADD